MSIAGDLRINCLIEPTKQEFYAELPTETTPRLLIKEMLTDPKFESLNDDLHDYFLVSKQKKIILGYNREFYDYDLSEEDDLILFEAKDKQKIIQIIDVINIVPNEVIFKGVDNIFKYLDRIEFEEAKKKFKNRRKELLLSILSVPSQDELEIQAPASSTSRVLIQEIINHPDFSLPNKEVENYILISKSKMLTLDYDKEFYDYNLVDNDQLLLFESKDKKKLIELVTDLGDTPNEIIIKGIDYLDQYFASFNKNKKVKGPINESKLIFVGAGQVGKTSLVRRMIDDQFDENQIKTEGIDITKCLLIDNHRILNLNVWDFGGQEIMHATHKFFMTARSVYVLVINPRTQDQHSGDFELEYWLKLISSYGGNSPIIIVTNKCDVHKSSIAEGTLKDKFPQIVGFVETSCKDNTGIDDLKGLIGKAVLELKHINDLIPYSFLEVKYKLENINSDYLSHHQYLEICDELAPSLTETDKEVLIRLLNDLGVVLNISNNRRLSNTQVLNPEWITKGVYSIINSNKLLESKGVINEKEITKILDPSSYPTKYERGFIMDMMNHFELCYQLPHAVDTYFVPGAFPKDKPDNIRWDFENYLHFQFKYDVLPSSIISRFLVKMHSSIVGDSYWRLGALIEEEGAIALIEVFPVDRKITIKVAGKQNKRYLLTIIRREFEQIHKSLSKLQVESLILLDARGEKSINYHDLIVYEEEGIEFYFEPKERKKYIVKHLLDGVEERHDLAELKSMIANNNLHKVLQYLVANFHSNNEVLLLSSRYKSLTEDQNAGRLDQVFFTREINNISFATLELLDKLPI